MVHTLCRSSTFPSRNCSVSCSGYSASRKTSFARRTSDEIRAKLCPRRAECKTGLWNRRHWEGLLSQQFERCRAEKLQCCLVLFDLDHFKRVNDTKGHARW